MWREFTAGQRRFAEKHYIAFYGISHLLCRGGLFQAALGSYLFSSLVRRGNRLSCELQLGFNTRRTWQIRRYLRPRGLHFQCILGCMLWIINKELASNIRSIICAQRTKMFSHADILDHLQIYPSFHDSEQKRITYFDREYYLQLQIFSYNS